MTTKIKEFPKIAEPTIETVFQQYLDEADTTNETTLWRKEEAIHIFTCHLDSYAHHTLSPDESKILEFYCNLAEDEEKQFCEIFGADKIAENVGEFLNYYLAQKVMASPTRLGQVAREIKKLCLWLGKKEYITPQEAKESAARAAVAAKTLPRAAKAAQLLWKESRQAPFHSKMMHEGYMHITKITTASIWLCPIGGKEVGPIFLPLAITELLEVGWEVNCVISKHDGELLISEVGNIYPH